MRAEEQYIISQYPVSDLLHCHDNPEIREFVDKYIRPMKEWLQDIGGDVESERLARQADMDVASMYRIDQQMAGVDRIERDSMVIRGALSSAGQAIGAAGRQTRILISLTEERTNLQLMFRELNKFLSGVMERRMLPSREEFSQFLTQKICNLSNIADSQKYFVDLYISLQYGNAKKLLSFTYAFAKTHGLFPEAVQAIEEEVNRKFRQQMVEYVRREQEGYKRMLEEFDEGIADKKRRIKVMRERDFVAFGTKDLEQEEKWLADMQRDKERYVAQGEPKALPIIFDYMMTLGGKNVFKTVPPADVPSRVLTDRDIEKVKAACLREFDTASTRAINVIR